MQCYFDMSVTNFKMLFISLIIHMYIQFISLIQMGNYLYMHEAELLIPS